MFKLFISLLTLCILVSCSKVQEDKENIIEASRYKASSQKNKPESTQKLTKEGWITFQTEDRSLTKQSILKSVEQLEGYISSDQESNQGDHISNTLIIRVPAEKFELLLKGATQGVTNFDVKNIKIKDVTEEFLDIQARLKTKKELESRYLILLNKANKVSEILEIEKQAGELRSEIEASEGKLNYLESQIAFSTLTIKFYEEISSESGFGQIFKNGFKNGWKNLLLFFVLLTNFWPFLIIATGVFIWFKKRKS
jgi:hypothetical protein